MHQLFLFPTEGEQYIGAILSTKQLKISLITGDGIGIYHAVSRFQKAGKLFFSLGGRRIGNRNMPSTWCGDRFQLH